MHVRGRAQVDVDDYRVRGRFRLDIDAAGTMTLALESSGPMSGPRTDVVVGWAVDTLRVLDREHGEYLEGEAVDARAAEVLDEAVDVAALVRRVLLAVRCADLEGARLDAAALSGRVDGGAFRVEFAGGRADRGDWPAPLERAEGERLRVDYRWEGGRLRGLTVRLPGRRWRVWLNGEAFDG